MQLSISFPDSLYPDVLFIANINSLVKDAAEAAAHEWGTDPQLLELYFEGNPLPGDSILTSHGVVVDSQLTASLWRWVTKDMLVEAMKNDDLPQLMTRFGSQTLILETPTFADYSGAVSFPRTWLPEEGVQSIRCGNPHPSVTSVAANFLRNSKVVDIDLEGLKNVTSVGDSFCSRCTSMTSLDLSALTSVTVVGHYFLNACSSLTKLDLRGLTNVTSVGYSFASRCYSLTSIDLSRLTNLTSIGNYFLNNCKALTTLDLEGISNVTSVGDSFLNGCSSITSLNLEHLSKIKSRGSDFLCGVYLEGEKPIKTPPLPRLPRRRPGWNDANSKKEFRVMKKSSCECTIL
eukprot:TRINITY_DN27820_c0_g1_i1.p1 TRINITY_DN27820_c0_g1~~TRINITY_DN27820_c0_g1_i1.p1  ORF type:complete len:360 (+),score=54.61 TRINITY_DN27820_c0_g1_i1:41-1081(+)